MTRRLLFVVTEDWYFWSHRLAVARAARDAGYAVTVATRVRAHAERIRAEGFGLAAIGLRRSGAGPVAEARSVAELVALYRRLRPDLVHHVALKPVLYGSLAARMAGLGAVVNALAGLGFLYASATVGARALRVPARLALRALLAPAHGAVVVQNPDDRAVARGLGVPEERLHLIPGSGVDTAALAPTPEPDPPVVALMVSRMLRDKGVLELAEAARRLRDRGTGVRVRLVGPPDPDNPSSLSRRDLDALALEGAVEWLGPREDIAAQWRAAHVGVLPSYREGLPRSLLEAAACGRALIATDVPGCREIVRHGSTGLLVPPRDPGALAAAIERLAGDAPLRRRLGREARRLVEERFSDERIVADTLALYRSLAPV